MSSYRVSLDAFEGPLDLLLYLVKHDEVDIRDISLERITRQFLEFVEQARELDIPVAGEFIVMAANLIYWKSRELLPAGAQTAREGEDEDLAGEGDPRWDLIRQLLEYKKFKDAAAHLGDWQSARALRHAPRPGLPHLPQGPDPGDAELGVAELAAAFQRVLARASAEARPGQIMDDRWTVPSKIETLREALPPGRAVGFRTLFHPEASREEWIVTFLAILELMKTRELQASQNEFLGDIELQRL